MEREGGRERERGREGESGGVEEGLEKGRGGRWEGEREDREFSYLD